MSLIAATYLNELPGVEARILDAFALGLSVDEISERPEVVQADWICIPYTHDHREIETGVVFRLMTHLRGLYPQKTFVFYNRFRIEETLAPELRGAAYFLEGDFEHLFVKLVQAVRAGEPATALDGVSTSDGHRAERVYYEANADLKSWPDFELLPMKSYVMAPHRREESAVYYSESAKGCSWGRCSFCQENSARLKDRKSYRPRSPENVVAEMEAARARYGAQEIQFNNAQFQVELPWLRRFNELLDEKKLQMKWSALSRADFLNAEVVALLKRAGCYNVLIGIESIEEDICESIHKNSKLRHTERGIRLLKEAGIGITGSFLIGLPGDTPRQAFRSMRFARQAGVDYAQVFIAKWGDPRVLEEFAEQGKLLKTWDYSKFDFCGQVFVPKAYGSLFMLKLVQQLCFFSFYLHPVTIVRIVGRIRRLSDLKRVAAGGWTLLTLGLRPIHALRKSLTGRLHGT